MAKVTAINIITRKGVPKVTIPDGEFLVDFGLKGDAHGGNWNRQVSLLGQESIDKMTALGIRGLCTGKFTENITTQGIVLCELPVGARFAIADCVFQVTQIGKECHQKCAVFHNIGDCNLMNEVIFARVLKGGIVRCGDEIVVL